ncbi:hypothetical protein [Staphylococcus muscae]|uniref:Uncharacterized protein n=1 Tax=Staphylococcus muscae TaxID=1294 RepID=A0A240CCL2_9STAP|nr:hypothetical protein [Staphylococcus muscae]GGA82859.1 hypothetical protein GCM10007183_03840 [Staphylococcus muscae]SNW04788.1 Uncharacterised protein [Staphylococcus muscae]
MKKIISTMTYGSFPLKLKVKQNLFSTKTVEIKAVLDTETGEVTFKISNEDLKYFKSNN